MMGLRKAKQLAWEDTISVHFVTRCFQTLLSLGLLDEMSRKGAVNVKEFSQRNGLNEKLLLAVCDALFAREILRKEGADVFALDERGKFLLENDLSRGWFYLSLGYENVLYNLEDLVRGKMKYGTDIVRDGKFVALGSGLASKHFYFPLVVEHIRKGGYKRVLDIGCGDGEFLQLVCETLPGVNAVGFDLSPEAISVGRQRLKTLNLSGRIALHPGDAFRIGEMRDRLKGVDAATIFLVLHEFCGGANHERAVAFLRAYRETLPGVPFHIIETLRPTPEQMRSHPGPAIEYFLFHDLSDQTPVCRETWKGIFREAGFTSVKEDLIPLARTVIFTVE
jgi:ubiquinone/menaquinone biosynthesis C-methylase UbiE